MYPLIILDCRLGQLTTPHDRLSGIYRVFEYISIGVIHVNLNVNESHHVVKLPGFTVNVGGGFRV